MPLVSGAGSYLVRTLPEQRADAGKPRCPRDRRPLTTEDAAELLTMLDLTDTEENA